jgi:transposase
MNKTPREQRGQARVKTPERTQVEMQLLSLDQWLDQGHRARVVWQYVESLDLTELYGRIKATSGNVGRDAIDPRILFALWLLATIEGFTSARRLADLTTRDIPYMWICGGVSVNYHRLSDFRVDHGDLLEQIMIDSIGVLLHQNLVTLQSVAQDGMRVRASAGAASFRREKTLDECLAQAEKHLQELKEQQDGDPSGDDRRAKAAAKRAAQEQVERIARAKEELAALNERRKKNRVKPTTKEARASTTDPQAQRMKMADGGFRPAFNVQFATDGETRMVVGVDVVQAGGDQGQMAPMHEKVCNDYDTTPEEYLVDGGFSVNDDIVTVEKRDTTVYGVIKNAQKQLDEGKDPYAAKRRDAPEMAAFRARMGTPEGQQKYSQRAGIAEFPNAECRNRGLTQFRVRGLVKAKAQTMWHVLAHNFNRLCHLGYLEAVMAS